MTRTQACVAAIREQRQAVIDSEVQLQKDIAAAFQRHWDRIAWVAWELKAERDEENGKPLNVKGA